MSVKERQDFAADDRLLLSGLLNHWAAAICFSISCLNLKQCAARTKNKLPDLQQNENKDLVFAKVCLRQWRHASQLSFIVCFFSSLFRANSTTDPRSTAGKELLFSQETFFWNSVVSGVSSLAALNLQPPQPSEPLTPRRAPSPLLRRRRARRCPATNRPPCPPQPGPPRGLQAAPSGSPCGCRTHLFGRSSPIKFSATFSSC